MTTKCEKKSDQQYYHSEKALVLVEMIIVIIILALMTTITTFAFPEMIGRTKFKKQADSFIRTMTMAQNAAAQTDRRYAVILDLDEQTYTLRQFASLDLETIPEEEAILKIGYFTDDCQLDYVLFDDYTVTDEDVYQARFMAGHSGWQYGGKIVLLDREGNPYSVVISRISRVIKLHSGDVQILTPQYKENVPF